MFVMDAGSLGAQEERRTPERAGGRRDQGPVKWHAALERAGIQTQEVLTLTGIDTDSD
ncbi:hypothetical protein BOO71_0007450 [Deinococcus marmoris]|uniref:Uncharacterized protein n=2 Tax=Deinococcus marmoris TaxID=249408 RepID=A0A1U7NYA7_9DEIO|nr:hypothetical protein BOO71_0007450 [Deinococcus marmoris]